MKSRCHNPNDAHYKYYGGRGINVYSDWKDFLPFYEWAISNGYKEGMTLDRIDNDRNYEPSNCRWATMKEQANNKRNNHMLTYNGKTQTLTQWAKECGIARTTLSARIIRGWSVSEALSNKKEVKQCGAKEK